MISMPAQLNGLDQNDINASATVFNLVLRKKQAAAEA